MTHEAWGRARLLLSHSHHLSPPSSLGMDTALMPALQIQKHEFREVKRCTQGHTAGGRPVSAAGPATVPLCP